MISLIFVLYGKRAVTEMGLASLEQTLGPKLGDEVELVLVDNASPDDTSELLDAWEHRATVIPNPTNLNFAGGCNVGARAASGDVLVFLNNDIEFVPGTIEAVAATAAAPDVGAVGARLLFPDGTIQHAGVIWAPDDVGPAMPIHTFHHEAGDIAPARAVLDLDAVTGACLAIRRELFLELGGFDERYRNGLEDIDLCLRIRSLGLRIVYRGDVCLVHHESVTRGVDDDANAHNDAIFKHRWSAVTAADEALAAGAYGGTLTSAGRIAPVPPPWDSGVDISVEGHLRSVAPEAAEARALLVALEVAELRPGTGEGAPARLVAGVADAEAQWCLDVARTRWIKLTALRVEVPFGSLYAHRRRHGDILRLAAVPEDPSHLDGVRAVWAATPALAAELVALGLDPARVAYLPPPVLPPPAGTGGAGLLALIPGADPELSGPALSSLSTMRGPAIRLLPSVSTPALIQQVAALCPQAELLAPTASEAAFAELAGQADGVLCLDPFDVFHRRALLAAATGTPVAAADGPAAQVLGEDLVGIDGDPAASGAAVLERSGNRTNRRQTVIERCSPAPLAAQVHELVTQARSLGGGIISRLTRTPV